jgi:2-(1,2-epoxy-1,2-dihydrophenyl)acetyl-CoA isomerase
MPRDLCGSPILVTMPVPPTHEMAGMSDYKTIRYDVAGNRATITLNRPDHLNGITNTMMRELFDCVSCVALDPDVRIVQLTGAGRGFCPGADLKAYTSGEPQEPNRKEYFQITAMLHEMPKVTVAAINGACAGAGFGWACACDLRYAATGATFNTAFLGVAISGDMAGPWLLPRIIGATKARELYFLPGKFSAAEAERIGLVARTFPDEAFRAEIEAIMDRLAAAAPLAIGEMKKNFTSAENMGLRDYIELETERHSRTGASDDSREAFRAFVEKRQPEFKGR